MKDLERRARQAARQQQEEADHAEAQRQREYQQYLERIRAERAELAADDLERLLGVRVRPSAWKIFGVPDRSYDSARMSYVGDLWGVAAEVKGVRVYWYQGTCSLSPEHTSFGPGREMTLADFGRALDARGKRKRRR